MNVPRIVASSKYQAAWLTTVFLSVALYFTASNPQATRAEKQAAVEKYILAVAGAWGVAAAGTAYEDGKQKQADRGGAPTLQVNTGEGATNVQPLAPPEGSFKPILTPAPPPERLP